VSYNINDHKGAAAAKGCIIVYPAECELQIDLDSLREFETFNLASRRLQALLPHTWAATQSPSGDPCKVHVVVTLTKPVASHAERILLQALFGSDVKKELMSWREMLEGEPNPCRLFEKDPLSAEAT
jgi:hypothetical protein